MTTSTGADGIDSDDFQSGGTIDSLWTEEGTGGSPTWTLNGQGTSDARLNMAFTNSDHHPGLNTEIALTQTVSTGTADFEIECKIDTVSGNAGQEAGIIIYSSTEKNYAGWYEDATVGWVAYTEGDNWSFQWTNDISDPPLPHWLQLERSGDDFTVRYSTNGTDFSVVGGPFTVSWTVDRVGMYVGNFEATDDHDADFDYFFETSAEISPEDEVTGTARRVLVVT